MALAPLRSVGGMASFIANPWARGFTMLSTSKPMRQPQISAVFFKNALEITLHGMKIPLSGLPKELRMLRLLAQHNFLVPKGVLLDDILVKQPDFMRFLDYYFQDESRFVLRPFTDGLAHQIGAERDLVLSQLSDLPEAVFAFKNRQLMRVLLTINSDKRVMTGYDGAITLRRDGIKEIAITDQSQGFTEPIVFDKENRLLFGHAKHVLMRALAKNLVSRTQSVRSILSSCVDAESDIQLNFFGALLSPSEARLVHVPDDRSPLFRVEILRARAISDFYYEHNIVRLKCPEVLRFSHKMRAASHLEDLSTLTGPVVLVKSRDDFKRVTPESLVAIHVDKDHAVVSKELVKNIPSLLPCTPLGIFLSQGMAGDFMVEQVRACPCFSAVPKSSTFEKLVNGDGKPVVIVFDPKMGVTVRGDYNVYRADIRCVPNALVQARSGAPMDDQLVLFIAEYGVPEGQVHPDRLADPDSSTYRINQVFIKADVDLKRLGNDAIKRMLLNLNLRFNVHPDNVITVSFFEAHRNIPSLYGLSLPGTLRGINLYGRLCLSTFASLDEDDLKSPSLAPIYKHINEQLATVQKLDPSLLPQIDFEPGKCDRLTLAQSMLQERVRYGFMAQDIFPILGYAFVTMDGQMTVVPYDQYVIAQDRVKYYGGALAVYLKEQLALPANEFKCIAPDARLAVPFFTADKDPKTVQDLRAFCSDVFLYYS